MRNVDGDKMTTINKGRWGKYTVKENKKVFFFPDEWLKILKIAKPRQQLNLNMQGHTGARIEEVLNLKVEDINFERNILTLKITKVRAKKKEKKPTPRLISISTQFAKQLKKYIKQYNLKQEDYFPMLKKQAITVALKNLAKKIGRDDYKDFSSHNLRKMHGNWLKALGVDSGEICLRMGHDYNTFLRDYASADIFKYEDKVLIRKILGDLYDYRERRF